MHLKNVRRPGRLSITLCAAALAAVLTASGIATAAAEDLNDLAWLCGAWGKDGRVIETWTAPADGLMLGVNSTPRGPGELPFFEYLRVEFRSDGTFYVASPLGRGATEFKLVEQGPARAVFENPQHDFPQRIAYWLEGDELVAEISAGEGEARRSQTFRWQRLPCECGGSNDTSS